MRKSAPILVAAVGLLLAGCSHGRGLRHAGGPDEFAVPRQAPLVIPPDFTLTPPQPGAARQNDAGPASDAQNALFGTAAPRSPSENAALDAAGRSDADPGIRSSAGSPTTNTPDKGQTTRDIIAAPEGDGQSAKTATPQ